MHGAPTRAFRRAEDRPRVCINRVHARASAGAPPRVPSPFRLCRPPRRRRARRLAAALAEQDLAGALTPCASYAAAAARRAASPRWLSQPRTPPWAAVSTEFRTMHSRSSVSTNSFLPSLMSARYLLSLPSRLAHRARRGPAAPSSPPPALTAATQSAILLLFALACLASFGSQPLVPVARAQSVTAAIPWNGWGNNLVRPEWGATNASAATLSRTLIPSVFADNVSVPAPSAAGSARAMVTALFSNASVAAAVANVPRTAAWSAFASHLTELVYLDLVRLAPNVSDPWPMPVPACDPEWDEMCLGGVTLPYFRVQATLTGPHGERAALNSATPYLDLEFLYGQSLAAAAPLRSFTDGQLLLPNGYLQNTTTTTAQLLDDVLVPAGTTLFLAGDLRINKNPALAAMVTLLAREHNRRAVQLKAAGQFVSDDDLFANARRWTIGVWQHMVHDDVLHRSMDLGVPKYNAVRTALGLTAATSFASISSTPAMQAALAAMYPSVSSVDACVGAWAEDPKPYARVGTTFATAWQRQLLAVRNGDRFWYQNTLANADYLAVKRRVWANLVSEFTGVARFPKSVVEVVPDASSAFVNVTTSSNSTTTEGGGSPVVKLTDGVWLNWTLSTTSITFEATVTKSGWFAFAIGSGMPNFQDVALVTWVNGVPTIADAYTNGYAPAVDTTQPGGTSLLVLNYSKDALGRNHYVWTRPLMSTDPWDLNITNPAGPTSCAFALGTSPGVSYHGALRGVVALTFNTTTTNTGGVTLPPPTTVVSTNWPLGVQLLHGAFMVSAFYGAIPLGVITARYLVNKKWLNQHIKFSMFVLSQVSVSIATAIIGANIDLLALPHGMIGVGTMVLLMVATVYGALIAKELNASLRTYRMLRWSHIVVAMSAWGLGMYNCFLGLGIVVERNPDLEWLHWLLVFLTGFVAVIMASFEVWRIKNGKVMLKGLVKLNAAHAGAGHGVAAGVAGAMFAEADDDHDKTMPEFTWDDINAKIADGSLWLVIEGVVYDITYFVNSHPGDDILRYVGTDASAAFEGMPAPGPPPPAAAAGGTRQTRPEHARDRRSSGTSTPRRHGAFPLPSAAAPAVPRPSTTALGGCTCTRVARGTSSPPWPSASSRKARSGRTTC
ncbi:hypothetical protein AMAG_07884 [Allomyces macrogynus ATCC 38327]|uniref:Cytochrome b5 heme-binding domain-containing protein n=1 Tax=Allomyces macrogynus (strain ATCC 38327) TaxID=578462 RepID=A0A0L0SJN5_ALLM3|nr:hypothetical protein AMAG_07884 [Allomyces macrogynus ATCC 38327]|eukprot:KNE62692.1 hypothetical protein AMAG_07884 [Allomyces macrogynus ATCC 38327]